MRSYTLVAILGLITPLTAHALQSVQVGWSNNRASTAAESYARGLADVARARGQYEMDSAQARISRADARSLELDNRMKSTETYFARRNFNREQRFGTEEDKYEKKRANQERYASFVRQSNPGRLTNEQLDPLTGKIQWVPELMPAVYKEYRERLDALFQKRARQDGTVDKATYAAIKDATGDLLQALRDNNPNFRAEKYVAAKSFVNALAYTAETSDHS